MSETLHRLIESFQYKAKSGYATPQAALVFETPALPLADVVKLYERDPTCKSSVDLLAASAVGAGFYTTVNETYEKAAQAKAAVDNFNENVNLAFNGNITVALYDTDGNGAIHEITVGNEKWFQNQIPAGNANADTWQIPAQFSWSQIHAVRVTCWFTGVGSGSFWVDGLFFGGRQYSSLQEDVASQNSIGLRELAETNEEFCSDPECESHAKALLANLKDPSEALTVQSTVIDYGATPILAGDKIHVTLPNEGVDSDFRVLCAEYKVDGKTQTLTTTLELGREKPLLADYVYALRSRTDRLSRIKTSKRGG